MINDDRQSGAPDLASIFLGPKAENAEFFERLLLDAFRDHVFWRRNFHPSDGFLVQEMEKQSASYERATSGLRQELMGLLGELKGGVPFFSPRYIGHMSSDLTMASLIGYFATMLYNPNNVASEASPVTSRMETEVSDQLAAMIGYPAERQWGHLCSGGTVANFEAIWVARNVKYLPVALHWACNASDLDIEISRPNGSSASIRELDLWGLLNIEAEAALDAAARFRDQFDDPVGGNNALQLHSLAALGYQEFGSRLAAEFGDELPPAVVLVPSTGHYSWEKICRSLGIGSSNIVQIPVDDAFRMDCDALESTLAELAASRTAVIACVSVVGTTEESAIDRLDRVADIKRNASQNLGLAFHLHADAAYGGYAASITRNDDGSRRKWNDLDDGEASWPTREVFDSLVALEHTDSVTIDPHKLGFVPYPAGAICLRDRRSRDLVAVEAPYLFHRGASEWGYIGRYIFEGSKPGAAAAGVWMSHKVLPLNCDGYGRLIRDTARGAQRLHWHLQERDWGAFDVHLLPSPDINIVCFAVGHPSLETLADVNEFVARIYQAMSTGRDGRQQLPDYFVTKTILQAGSYGRSAIPLVEALGFGEEDYREAGGIGVIRCTVMDPFLADSRGRTDHAEGFATTLAEVFGRELAGYSSASSRA